jgi:tetrapyrrole methylase family protein/MazG family protein
VEELGDLLLQVILNAEIGRQAGQFTLADVIQGITEKMIHRHPHVFGDVKVDGSAEVLNNWAKIKDAEKALKSETIPDSPFASIPETLPALIRAQKIGAKTVRYNFDWENSDQVVAKVDEELGELKEAIQEKSPLEQQKELGDLLFSITQLARHLNFDAEQALRMTNKKFEKRFIKMRGLVADDGRDFTKLPVQELEKYWQKAKVGEV